MGAGRVNGNDAGALNADGKRRTGRYEREAQKLFSKGRQFDR